MYLIERIRTKWSTSTLPLCVLHEAPLLILRPAVCDLLLLDCVLAAPVPLHEAHHHAARQQEHQRQQHA